MSQLVKETGPKAEPFRGQQRSQEKRVLRKRDGARAFSKLMAVGCFFLFLVRTWCRLPSFHQEAVRKELMGPGRKKPPQLLGKSRMEWSLL